MSYIFEMKALAFQKYKTKILTLKRGLNIRYRLSIRRFVANKKKGGGY